MPVFKVLGICCVCFYFSRVPWNLGIMFFQKMFLYFFTSKTWNI